MNKGTLNISRGIRSQNKTQRGFTRIELAVVVATVTLIGTTGARLLGDNRERSERAVCGNNLRQIGRAFNMWASDHGGENPFWTHYEAGGTWWANGSSSPPGNFVNIPGFGPLIIGLRNNAFFHFIVINQELGTPAILVCPSEQNKRRAQDFSNSSNGLYSANFQNRATSYFVGLHAMNQHPSSMLSGDRTLRADYENSGSCAANVGNVSLIVNQSTSGWLPGLHNAGGNLLLNDGRVEELSNPGLATFLRPGSFVEGHHYANPF